MLALFASWWPFAVPDLGGFVRLDRLGELAEIVMSFGAYCYWAGVRDGFLVGLVAAIGLYVLVLAITVAFGRTDRTTSTRLAIAVGLLSLVCWYASQRRPVPLPLVPAKPFVEPDKPKLPRPWRRGTVGEDVG